MLAWGVHVSPRNVFRIAWDAERSLSNPLESSTWGPFDLGSKPVWSHMGGSGVHSEAESGTITNYHANTDDIEHCNSGNTDSGF